MQILLLWGLKKCRNDDSFYVEGVPTDYISGFCWYCDVCIILNQKATRFPWVFKFTFYFNQILLQECWILIVTCFSIWMVSKMTG